MIALCCVAGVMLLSGGQVGQATPSVSKSFAILRMCLCFMCLLCVSGSSAQYDAPQAQTVV